MAWLKAMSTMVGIDLLFVALLAVIALPLGLRKRAALAVLRRNFVGYFSNPTGYVFLFLFVLLTSFAAFWPHEFFNANLANLDQLNKYLPLVMLIFIPAITMSIWAEERRQGTDELLLTLPAGDFDIVIGKYLAAASIFTASLIYSQICNYSMLVSLTDGQLDAGLIMGTYLGYWLTGMAMLAVGMVASFLTSNLTVSFILGVVLNSPFVFAQWADVIVPDSNFARGVAGWSIAVNADDLGRGVISISSVIYFAMIIGLGLYISQILIGVRHWAGAQHGSSMFFHYLARVTALIALVLGLTIFFGNYDVVRWDVTDDKVSSLSEDTLKIIEELQPEHRIMVDAFVSANVPEVYVQTKYDLISLLKEFKKSAGQHIEVTIHDGLETFSDAAALAEERFGIQPQFVRSRSQGKIEDDEIIMGAAVTCGLEKVVIPFFDYGVPVEYELIRSISTVSKGERRKLGVVRTGAQLMGGMSAGFQQIPKQEIVGELEKQFDVEEVDPATPIDTEKYAALLVVQPSSLSPEAMEELVVAIEAGVPTAIFEDPLPAFMSYIIPTGEPNPRPGGGGMMGMFGGGGGGPPPPKADIQRLWEVLGIESPGTTGMGVFQPELVWQPYNPYPKLKIQGIPEEWIFVRRTAPGFEDTINQDDKITSGLDELFFPMPGLIRPKSDTELKFTKLVSTSEFSGRIAYQDFKDNQGDRLELQRKRGEADAQMKIVAARIRAGSDGKEDSEDTADEAAEEAESSSASEPVNRSLHVVYVADLDLMSSAFLRIRAQPDENDDLNWQFENVTFLLNIVDSLVGDEDYVEIRKRKSRHTTLKIIEAEVQKARDEETKKRLDFQGKYDAEVATAEEEKEANLGEAQQRVNKLLERQEEGEDVRAALQAEQQRLAMLDQVADRRRALKVQQAARKRDADTEKIRRESERDVDKVQKEYKIWAVAVPPIPPLLLGILVFIYRRTREREGIARSRLK
ncbi:MAG: Gldg family protein [Pirellulaceae bacterium]|nr:Gldg family protein [Pirellulaceae bacterium]